MTLEQLQESNKLRIVEVNKNKENHREALENSLNRYSEEKKEWEEMRNDSQMKYKELEDLLKQEKFKNEKMKEKLLQFNQTLQNCVSKVVSDFSS